MKYLNEYAEYCSRVQRRISRRSFIGQVSAGGFISAMASSPWSPAHADDPPIFHATISHVLDAHHFSLTDGQEVILPHIIPPGLEGFIEDQEAERRFSTQLAADLVLGKQIRLELYDNNRDRYGRYRARVVFNDGDISLNLAHTLLQRGLVRLFPEPDADPLDISPMLAQEDRARAQRNGLWGGGPWGRSHFHVHLAAMYQGGINRFAMAQGVVQRVIRISDRYHLEFTGNWREDFTVGLSTKVLRQLGLAHSDKDHFEGKTIEVRGWVRLWNGPYMEIPEASGIRILND